MERKKKEDLNHWGKGDTKIYKESKNTDRGKGKTGEGKEEKKG